MGHEVDVMDVNKYRKDFPILQKEVGGMPVVYFDNACMTLKPRPVIDAMMEYYTDYPACGGRSVHKLSNKVTMKVEESRRTVKEYLNAERDGEIVFTKNATEAMNIVSYGLDWKKGDKVITTDREHNSNLVPWHNARDRHGAVHETVQSKDDTTFDIERYKSMMSKDVKLVSMVHTCNMDGYTTPVKDIIEIAHDHGALVMLDGAQAGSHKDVDVQALDVDFYCISVHKCLGPTGVGALYGKFDLLKDLSPFIVGGDTVQDTTLTKTVFLKPPSRFEAGLQNYSGIIGTAPALRYIMDVGRKNIEEHETLLNRTITDGLKDEAGLHILGPQDPDLRSGVFSFSLDIIDAHDVAMILDETANIMIRSGMLCVHSWFNKHDKNGTARASVYFYNTVEEAKFFVEKIKDLIQQFS
jgi:cysteine desulfurase/selenocysteine lyase